MNNRWMTMMALALLTTALGGACQEEPEASAEDCGSEGSYVEHQGSSYCLYPQPITETGFSCPGALPHQFDRGGVSICGGDPQLSQQLQDVIAAQAPSDWPENNMTTNNVTTNNTTTNNTTTNNLVNNGTLISGGELRFTECDAIEKTTEYCAEERLLWSYDAATRELKLDNERISLNCCGDRSLRIIKDAEPDRYRILLQDAPETLDDGTEARCNCTCVYDWGATIPDVEPGIVSIAVQVEVTDGDFGDKLYEETLDLSMDSGVSTVSTEEALFCMEGE